MIKLEGTYKTRHYEELSILMISEMEEQELVGTEKFKQNKLYS